MRLLAGSFVTLAAFAPTTQAADSSAGTSNHGPSTTTAMTGHVPPVPERGHSPYQAGVAGHALRYYTTLGGIDNLKVQRTASDNLIRFSYRVVDPVRAKPLGDKKATPYLLGLRSRAVLQIPVMDKIGQLRQAGMPEAGKEYWMVFSNKGNLVKAGDRVNVVIGAFHVDGLVVE